MREFPAWKEKKLGTLFSKIEKRNNNKSISNVITNSAVYGLVKQRAFFDKDIANKENTDKYYVIENGDFVYNPRKSNEAPYGPIQMYEGKATGIVSPLYLCLKPSKKDMYLPFMKHYFHSTVWHKFIYKNGDTGARGDRVSIKVQTLLNMPIFLPSLPEQQKIANFLSSYDSMIDNQSKRVEVLKLRKNGILQKIFSQELRFRDNQGNEFPDWQSDNLLNRIEFEGGSQPPASTFSRIKKEGYVRFIQNRDYKTDKFITYIPLKLAKKFCDVDDIMIGRYGPPIFVIHKGIKGAYNVALMKAMPVNLNKQYMYYYLQYRKLIRYIERLSRRTAGQDGFSPEILSGFPFFVPTSPEQQKIADFLTAVDKQIDVEEKRLETMKTIKKGLLQQLFV